MMRTRTLRGAGCASTRTASVFDAMPRVASHRIVEWMPILAVAVDGTRVAFPGA